MFAGNAELGLQWGSQNLTCSEVSYEISNSKAQIIIQ